MGVQEQALQQQQKQKQKKPFELEKQKNHVFGLKLHTNLIVPSPTCLLYKPAKYQAVQGRFFEQFLDFILWKPWFWVKTMVLWVCLESNWLRVHICKPLQASGFFEKKERSTHITRINILGRHTWCFAWIKKHLHWYHA